MRKLSWVDGVGIGIGAMIGGGIFTLSALAIKVAGSGALLAFIFCSFIALLIGYIYAELSAKNPSAGGSYSMVSLIMPQSFQRTYGYLLALAYSSAIAFYAKTFANYAFPVLHLPKILLEILPVILFTALNYAGAKESAKTQNAIVALKLLILLFFASLALKSPAKVSFSFSNKIFLAASFIFIAFEGFELITNAAEEMKNPRKDVKLAIFASIIAVSLIYLAVTYALLSLGRWEGEAPLADAASRVIGKFAYVLMFIGATVSTFSAINGTVFGLARLIFALARDKALPSFLSRLEQGLPRKAILAEPFMILPMLFFPLEALASFSSAVFLLAFISVAIAALNAGIRKAIPLSALFLSLLSISFGGYRSISLAVSLLILIALPAIYLNFLKSKDGV